MPQDFGLIFFATKALLNMPNEVLKRGHSGLAVFFFRNIGETEMSNESLILADAAAPCQLFLLEAESVEIDRSQPPGHYTGERLFQRRPDVYRLVVDLLAEPGVSIRQICRAAHVTDGTVQAVCEREGIPMAARKKEILRSITHELRLCSERVIEMVPEMSGKDALIGCGILAEKMQLLSGGATMILERLDSAEDIYSTFNRLHQQLVETIAKSRENGLAAGNGLQKADAIEIESAAPVMELAR